MSLFQFRPPPGQLQTSACGDLTRSGTGLQHTHFQGITPISVFSFQLPQAEVWGTCRGSVKQSCCEMTYLVRCPELLAACVRDEAGVRTHFLTHRKMLFGCGLRQEDEFNQVGQWKWHLKLSR